MSKRIIVILALIWMIILVAGVSTSLTLALSGAENSSWAGRLTGGQDIIVTEDEYAIISRYKRLDEVLALIKNEYFQETDEEDLVLGAIRGMVSSLNDPYSYYRTSDEMSQEQERQQGVYKGIGLQLLDEGDQLLIMRVFAGSPADEAGILAGDVLVGVAGVDLTKEEEAMNTAKNLLVGENGTSVSVEVKRGEDRLTFEVKRADVVINRVVHTMLENDIGYIAIYEFMGDDVEGFSEALKAVVEEEARGLIIDLRSNPGGLLSDVVEISDMLLDEGLIVYVESRSGARDSYYSDADACTLPLAVLVNNASASASEILAGAVQDRDRGVIVGETTFGKGIVQSIIPFYEDGAGIHLTTASYFTPSGRSIHESGIEPDIPVQQSDEDEISPEMPDIERDTQLRTAFEYLVDHLEEE